MDFETLTNFIHNEAKILHEQGATAESIRKYLKKVHRLDIAADIIANRVSKKDTKEHPVGKQVG